MKSLRLLGEESRLRLLRLLEREELSVAELQEILAMGQSRISMALSQLRQAGLVEVRRAGQKSLYRYTGGDTVTALLREAAAELAEAAADDKALRLVLRRRTDRMRSYFDSLAGRVSPETVPGRSWQGLCELLFRLLPPLRIADIGSGEGTLSLLLARSAIQVTGVDNSERMVAFAQAAADRAGVRNAEFRLGDLEDLPLGNDSVDVALFSQSLHHAIHPERAMEEAWRILAPGGTLAILDLHRHHFEAARELYADQWLGFTQGEILELLGTAGFSTADVTLVHRESEEPHLETLLAVARKPREGELAGHEQRADSEVLIEQGPA